MDEQEAKIIINALFTTQLDPDTDIGGAGECFEKILQLRLLNDVQAAGDLFLWQYFFRLKESTILEVVNAIARS